LETVWGGIDISVDRSSRRCLRSWVASPTASATCRGRTLPMAPFPDRRAHAPL